MNIKRLFFYVSSAHFTLTTQNLQHRMHQIYIALIASRIYSMSAKTESFHIPRLDAKQYGIGF